MRVALLSRYPRVDTARWKLGLVRGIREAGHETTVVYTRSALADQVRAGLREFGLDAWARYRQARRQAPGGPRPDPESESVRDWAKRRGVPVLLHRRIGDPELLEELRALAPDLIVLAGADIVPAPLLELPPLGAINPHYGLLPGYRGMNVAEWSVFCNEPVGVTVHYVDPGIDTGDILEREPVAVEPGDTLLSIRAKQQKLAQRLLLRAVERIDAGTAERMPQALEEGRQFYRMHPALRQAVARSLESGRYATDRSTSARNMGA